MPSKFWLNWTFPDKCTILGSKGKLQRGWKLLECHEVVDRTLRSTRKGTKHWGRVCKQASQLQDQDSFYIFTGSMLCLSIRRSWDHTASFFFHVLIAPLLPLRPIFLHSLCSHLTNPNWNSRKAYGSTRDLRCHLGACSWRHWYIVSTHTLELCLENLTCYVTWLATSLGLLPLVFTKSERSTLMSMNIGVTDFKTYWIFAGTYFLIEVDY